MTTGYTYRKGVSTGPAMRLLWKDYLGAAIDFSTGWTFTVKIVASGLNAILESKTTGITGDDVSPNVIIDFDTADFDTLTAPGEYQVILTATPTSGDPIVFENLPTFILRPAPT